MLDIAQQNHLIGQQFQRPALPPIGSLATGQMNQLRLALAIQAAPLGAFAREASGEGHLQVMLHKPLFDPNHGAATDIQGLSDLPIGCLWFALIPIAHQQHPCHQIVLGRSSARMCHCREKCSLLLTQPHRIRVVIGAHACSSFLSSCRSHHPAFRSGSGSDHPEYLGKYFSDRGQVRLRDLLRKTAPHVTDEKACGAVLPSI